MPQRQVVLAGSATRATAFWKQVVLVGCSTGHELGWTQLSQDHFERLAEVLREPLQDCGGIIICSKAQWVREIAEVLAETIDRTCVWHTQALGDQSGCMVQRDMEQVIQELSVLATGPRWSSTLVVVSQTPVLDALYATCRQRMKLPPEQDGFDNGSAVVLTPQGAIWYPDE